MNILKNTIKTSISKIIVCVVIAVASSCDYLSIQDQIDNDLAIDSIFTSKRYLEAYMWATADYLPDPGSIWGSPYTPGPMATDEGIALFSTGEFAGIGFVTGILNADNLENSSLGNWHGWYRVIRQTTTTLNRMDECKDCLLEDLADIRAHSRFLRAYAYYLLLANYGPVVLLGDEVINNNETNEYYDRPRNLYDECVEYICSELEAAAVVLPTTVQSVMDFGRPTKGAALGLVARLRLWHASDLYNGGNSARMYFSTWKRKTDGAHYIQQEKDERRWAVAAAAAKKLIDLNDGGGNKMYRLNTVSSDNRTRALSTDTPDPNYTLTWPDGAAGIDPYYSYSNMFNNETVMSVNPEFIWARASGRVTSYTQHVHPYANGGWNGLCVTQKIVDAYEMADGRDKNASSDLYPYNEGTFNTEIKWINSYYRIQPQVSNMYVNREARFYASIGFSGCYWDMASTSENSHKGQTVWYYVDQANGKYASSNPVDHPTTGYVLRKYVNPIDAWRGTGSRRISKPFPTIRYAEMLMIYAEALNELTGTHTIDGVSYSRDFEEIKGAYNQVRYRAGLPGITDADLANAADFLEKIKRERMVEFLHENHRYFDVRRWGDYERSESVPITGMNMEGTASTFYQRVVPATSVIAQRVVDRKMIFLPIPRDEMRRLPSFDQNPGW